MDKTFIDSLLIEQEISIERAEFQELVSQMNSYSNKMEEEWNLDLEQEIRESLSKLASYSEKLKKMNPNSHYLFK